MDELIERMEATADHMDHGIEAAAVYEGIAALRAYEVRVNKLEAALRWQPIETAPKDGTWVLLTGGSIDRAWDHDDDKPQVVVGQFRGSGPWQFAWYDSGWYGEYESPTRWMPVPALP